MPNYAIIFQNSVSNVIVADTEKIALEVNPQGAIAIEYTNENPAYIGWTWDGTKFTAPETPTE